jgi:myo-inositol-1-phosphate synthase
LGGVQGDRQSMLDQLRSDIRDFKQSRQLETVIVVWTANTERFSELRDGVNDTADNLLAAIRANHSEVAPSTLYAVASILEGVSRYLFKFLF